MVTRHRRALSTAIRYQTKAEKLLAAAPLPKRVGTCLKLDLAPWAPTPHLAAAANASLEAIREAAAGVHYKAAVIDASNITGSDVAALAAAPGEERRHTPRGETRRPRVVELHRAESEHVASRQPIAAATRHTRERGW